MSYALYDEDGFVGDVATVGGLRELRTVAFEQGNDAVVGLFEMGAAFLTDELIDGLKLLKPRKATVKKTLENLIRLVDKSDLLVIISGGESDIPVS